MKLQRFVTASGAAARRKAEQLVRNGRVAVGGRVVRDPIFEVDPARDDVRVDGRRVAIEEKVAVLLYKPRGVVTTLEDPQGRTTVADLVHGAGARVVPVGRLDFHTEGVLLLTNDGDLAHALLHPSRRVERVYHAKLRGHVERDALERLRRGVRLEDGFARADRVQVLAATGKHTWVEIALHEGRNRQIHRMALAVRHPVLKLARVSFAGMGVGDLEPGQWRFLSAKETARLRRGAERKPEEERGAERRGAATPAARAADAAARGPRREGGRWRRGARARSPGRPRSRAERRKRR